MNRQRAPGESQTRRPLLTLQEAVVLEVGDQVRFNPDMRIDSIRKAVDGFPGEYPGLRSIGLEPGEVYSLEFVDVQRGRLLDLPGTAGHMFLPSRDPCNVMFLLKDVDKPVGYALFSRA